jgi:hypothetical protein
MSKPIGESLPILYRELVNMAESGKWRERVELLQVLDALHWFDNYGAEHYNVRMAAIVHISDMLEASELDDQLQRAIDEANDAVGVE